MELSQKIPGNELFMESYQISKNFRLNYKDKSIIIILDKKDTSKQNMMYLIGILIKIKNMTSEDNK